MSQSDDHISANQPPPLKEKHNNRIENSKPKKFVIRHIFPTGGVAWVLATLLLVVCAGRASAQIDQRQFNIDLHALASLPSRVVGTEGYARAVDYLDTQLRQLRNVSWRRQDYPAMVPVTHSATLTTATGRAERVYPFWPASIRLCATPAGGIHAKLIYCGNGEPRDFPVANLNGAIAVLEASARENWTRAARLGASAIIILGSPDLTHADLSPQAISVPINLPRFYVPPGDFANDLRTGTITGEVTLAADVRWEQTTATNFYALVKPPRVAAGWTGTPPAALGSTVPFDAGCLVPDLAPGASVAVQAASGLALLRELANHPLDRPVLVCFTGADSLNMLGSRVLHLSLSDVPVTWNPIIKTLDATAQQLRLELRRAAAVFKQPTLLDPHYDRPLSQRLVHLVQLRASALQDQLFVLRTNTGATSNVGGASNNPADATTLRRELESRQALLGRLRYAFAQHPAELADPQLADPAREICRQAVQTLGGSFDGSTPGLLQETIARANRLRHRVSLYHWLASAIGRPTDPDPGDSDVRLIELMVGLDLGDGGYRAGPMVEGGFERSTTIAGIQDYHEWFSKTLADFHNHQPDADWYGGINGIIDLQPLSGVQSPMSWMPSNGSIPTEMAQGWGVPAFSMVTLDDLHLRRDTPADTLDHIHPLAILPQLRAVQTLLWHAWNDLSFRGPVDPHWQRTTLRGQVVSFAPGRPVPDLPRPGYLVATFPVQRDDLRIPRLQDLPYCVGIRRGDVRPCDADGNYRFEGIPKINPSRQLLAIEAFHIVPKTGAIDAVSDLATREGDIQVYANFHNQTVDSLRTLVFDCREFSLFGLYDPRYQNDLSDVLPLDARRNADPQKFNVLLDHRMMAGYAEPDSRLYLLFRYGRVGNRLILINMPAITKGDIASSTSADELGVGFSPRQLSKLGLLSLVTARDFYRIDELRLAKYAAAGVQSPLLERLHHDAGEELKVAESSYDVTQEGRSRAALPPVLGPVNSTQPEEPAAEPLGSVASASNAATVLNAADAAWASETRVYAAAQALANDVIRAAIFLLLLCVPFSFCMERLLIGSPNVYKQIGGVTGIFAIMTAALWSFHPAFRISASPLIIILSFAILFMSILVISVVYGKFNSELKRISSGRATASESTLARTNVLLSAVVLGIANMRRRKFRTVLTSLTIVLITFAVLAFTGSSRYLDSRTLPTGTPSKFSGVLLRERGFRQMSNSMAAEAQDALDGFYTANHKENAPKLVQRWWNVNPGDPLDEIHIVASPTQTVALAGMLGISPGEQNLSAIADVIGAKPLLALRQNQPRVVYLSDVVARQLGAKVGQTVSVGGIDLTIASIFSAADFDQKVTDLDGDSIAPLRYSADELDASGHPLDQNIVQGIGIGTEASGTYEHLSASNFAIVPIWVSRLLPNARLVMLAAKLGPDVTSSSDWVHTVAGGFSQRFDVAVFAGEKDGVQLVVASNLSRVSGAGQVAVPLAIAGLIVFNTMMGSIAERRREIHVYTSLGLAPLHVGALFLAEAMTYGLIGTVFGYIIGQGAGTLLLKMGWLGTTTLNYSGTSAMLTMGLILLIVLLSALVPARLAAKVAAPSIERNWKVPLPEGGHIAATLPFTINRSTADGVLAYLDEFLEAHREGSIGKFSASAVRPLHDGDERGLETTVWLTPFDLGVRQRLRLRIKPGTYPDIYEVHVNLKRLSGEDGNWYRMNRSFLTQLRHQFLQWRSLSPERMQEYVRESEDLLQR